MTYSIIFVKEMSLKLKIQRPYEDFPQMSRSTALSRRLPVVPLATCARENDSRAHWQHSASSAVANVVCNTLRELWHLNLLDLNLIIT